MNHGQDRSSTASYAKLLTPEPEYPFQKEQGTIRFDEESTLEVNQSLCMPVYLTKVKKGVAALKG
jgi:hypothetical protein